VAIPKDKKVYEDFTSFVDYLVRDSTSSTKNYCAYHKFYNFDSSPKVKEVEQMMVDVAKTLSSIEDIKLKGKKMAKLKKKQKVHKTDLFNPDDLWEEEC
jgi:hypothetical protein